MRFWRTIKIGGAALIACIFAIAAADFLFPPPLERGAEWSSVAYDRHGEWLHGFTTSSGRWRFSTEIEQIDPAFIERLLIIEDKRFYKHIGVDGVAILRALFQGISSGRVVSGASTITMQTARLLEPRPRTIPSKLIEMARALQIERRLSKAEILELYLTLAPYGGNIEGVRAASLLYYDKEPSSLNIAEQGLLIALPQAPEARRPDRNFETARRARMEILNRLAAAGSISTQQAQEESAAFLPNKRGALPRHAWHASRRLTDKTNEAHTSLDADLQRRAEMLVARYVHRYSDGATASLIIVDNKANEVVASVGSSGFDALGGWIDLTRALRSPGSTLKPLIYGFALGSGRLSTNSIIDDMPRLFDDYAPENFDRKFRGQVRVDEALRHSLNIPAVMMLEEVGPLRFLAELRASGADLSVASRARSPGLSLALGGAGITAVDLAKLYTGLANGGVVRPLQWHASPNEEGGDLSGSRRLFAADVAAQINGILRETPALPGRSPRALSQSAVPIAYKTGTSYGYRDAWAAGHNALQPRSGHTIVAWVGRADGAARSGATGRRDAAPLLFEAFSLLSEERSIAAIAPQPSIPQAHRPKYSTGPEIIFPRDGVELFRSPQDAGLSLVARGDSVRWYVDGTPIEKANGQAIWKPVETGFYRLLVVDEEGSSASSLVHVQFADQLVSNG